MPARELSIVVDAMNDRSMHARFSADTTAVAEEDVVDVLLEVWLRAIYGPAAG